jgi:hypothetical protein
LAVVMAKDHHHRRFLDLVQPATHKVSSIRAYSAPVVASVPSTATPLGKDKPVFDRGHRSPLVDVC